MLQGIAVNSQGDPGIFKMIAVSICEARFCDFHLCHIFVTLMCCEARKFGNLYFKTKRLVFSVEKLVQ